MIKRTSLASLHLTEDSAGEEYCPVQKYIRRYQLTATDSQGGFAASRVIHQKGCAFFHAGPERRHRLIVIYCRPLQPRLGRKVQGIEKPLSQALLSRKRPHLTSPAAAPPLALQSLSRRADA